MTGSKPQPNPVVLVVDDEALLRLHACDMLEEAGFKVLEAGNAQEALGIMRSRDDVRVLFTDIQMPGPIDGMELARQVHERWPRVVLLVTSGHLCPAEEDIPDDGRFISKPYAPGSLIAKVKTLLDQHPLAEDRA